MKAIDNLEPLEQKQILKNHLATFLVLANLGGVSSGWALTPAEILQKVEQKYEQMTSFSADGKTVSVIDASGLDISKNAAATPKAGNAKEKQEAQSKPQILTHTFTVKLGRPHHYRIEWTQVVNPGFTNKGAVWNAGDGDFLIVGDDRYSKMNNQEIALAAATGVSGGAAHTIPAIFFKTSASLLKTVQDLAQQKDERVDAEDCYVLAGSAAGQKIILWITKKNFLIKQKRVVLGGGGFLPEMSDDAIKEALKQLNREPTSEAIADMKKTIQTARQMTSQVKGTLTESYQNIAINQSFKKEMFKPNLPPGLKPSEL